MDESKGWNFDLQELEKSYKESKSQGKNVKAIVIINPGNPTGSILNEQTIKQVI